MKAVVDDIIVCIDLAMRLPLVVIPDPPASPGEHGSDGQQVIHLPGLEDPALRVQERYALAVDLEPRPEISGIYRSHLFRRQAGSHCRKPLVVAERLGLRCPQQVRLSRDQHLFWYKR